MLNEDSSYCKLTETGEWSETLRFFADIFKFSFNAPIPNFDVSYWGINGCESCFISPIFEMSYRKLAISLFLLVNYCYFSSELDSLIMESLLLLSIGYGEATSKLESDKFRAI